MSITFYYLFLFLLVTTTIFQAWLSRRHIAYIKKNKTKVPSDFSKIISISDHKKAADTLSLSQILE